MEIFTELRHEGAPKQHESILAFIAAQNYGTRNTFFQPLIFNS